MKERTELQAIYFSNVRSKTQKGQALAMAARACLFNGINNFDAFYHLLVKLARYNSFSDKKVVIDNNEYFNEETRERLDRIDERKLESLRKEAAALGFDVLFYSHNATIESASGYSYVL